MRFARLGRCKRQGHLFKAHQGRKDAVDHIKAPAKYGMGMHYWLLRSGFWLVSAHLGGRLSRQ